ncbi:organic hydroperoxide resistance protein [Rathayibacter sp. YIM 133350]|uniref:organic hydroperoxide resistance protein n=1 Tax=Rathayibacter sp. YIM 133350 TaxID=3131992 RepID=UPI00307F94B7
MNTLYTAEAISTGSGRNGHVRSDDGRVDLEMAIPKSMGGSGEGSNPEQLFAAGYAACFHSALHMVARSKKLDVSGSTVGGRVQIGPKADGEVGFTLAVLLEVVLPGIDGDTAQQLADAAHEVCPYSNATRGNIEVTIAVSDD